jgi:hypothetical protein
VVTVVMVVLRVLWVRPVLVRVRPVPRVLWVPVVTAAWAVMAVPVL